MSQTTATDEDVYVLASSPTHSVDLHLINDTAVGITVWEGDRLDIIVNSLLPMHLSWYVVQLENDFPVLHGFDNQDALDTQITEDVIHAFVHSDSRTFLNCAKARYMCQLSAGFADLKQCGELARMHIGLWQALYIFPAAHFGHPRLPGANFRVL